MQSYKYKFCISFIYIYSVFRLDSKNDKFIKNTHKLVKPKRITCTATKPTLQLSNVTQPFPIIFA